MNAGNRIDVVFAVLDGRILEIGRQTLRDLVPKAAKAVPPADD